MVVNKLVWAPRIHGLFARYEIIDLISIIMFSDCYQMRTRTTIQHSYIILTFNTCVFAQFLFFVVGFLCSGFSMCLEPCILGQRVTAPFWRLWKCPDSMARSAKKKAWLDRRKTGLGQMVGWSVAATEAWWQRCGMFRVFIPMGGHCCKLFAKVV